MNWIFEHNMDPDFNDPFEAEVPAAAEGGGAAGASNTSTTGSASGVNVDDVDQAMVQQLVDSLGCFTSAQVRAALKTTHNSMDRAADWLFSHMDDLDAAIAALESTSVSDHNGATTAAAGGADASPPSTNDVPSLLPLDDGPGTYKLRGCISHIGKNTGSGHYVCHLLKQVPGHDDNAEEKWVIFNDEKVALSEHPPLEHAYLYLFQREDTIGKPDERF
jgi:ubiquitin carboxyl-terminal hydrolase 5/13